MIITLAIRVIFQFLMAFENTIYPLFPQAVQDQITSVFNLLASGIPFINEFLDLNYLSILLSFWIVLSGLFFIAELVMKFWSLLTGNDVSTRVKNDG